MTAKTDYIASILLESSSITRHNAVLDHEREVAIKDLTVWNHFSLYSIPGPYEVTIGSEGTRIKFTVLAKGRAEPVSLAVPLAPFRGLIRDYFLICESYVEAVKIGNLSRIEAIDMSRRGLHNEGAELLQSLLRGQALMDSETARRLFTLLSVLHLK